MTAARPSHQPAPVALTGSGEATARDLFQRVADIMDHRIQRPDMVNKTMHETLVIVCAEGLKGSHHAFGDLNAQVETLIRKLNIPADEANAIRQMRRHSNRSTPLSPEDLLYDARALSGFIGRVFSQAVPHRLVAGLPHDHAPRPEALKTNTPDKRCIVSSWTQHTINVVVDEDGADEELCVRYTEETQYARMGYLTDILHTGMHLNLLGCEQHGNTLIPRLIIVEPDCLLDISVIASCFEDYGHHPLLYLVSRMREKPNTEAILLGNYAGSALNDIINDPQATPGRTLMRNFRERALEYSTCPDFNAETFKRDAVDQTAHLRQIVDELRHQYDLDKAILEPSFICEKLGLQGRVDLMTTDLKLLVEQKSGRNIFLERSMPNAYGAKVVEKHYVQLLLYYGILYYNFHSSTTDIRLLYSKYALPDGLVSVANLMKLVYEAIRFRNEAVALEFDMARRGIAHLLPTLTADALNTAGKRDFFYNRYLRPQLDSLLVPLQNLQPLERAYFCRMAQFAIRENLLGKVGVVEGTGNSVASLWNMPLSEKRETGNIYLGLTITKLEKSSHADANNGYDLITLGIPQQEEGFLPNFRRGDMVYLYAYPDGEEPDVRKALLFKGGLADIRTDQVTVLLADGQQNADIFHHLPYASVLLSGMAGARREQRFKWCIEHGSSDAGGSSAIRSLYAFVTSTPARKALLLGQRTPEHDATATLSRSYDPLLDPILLQAKQAQDYFLLVGPPGTGKTSRALRFIVEEALAAPQPGDATSILLLSYTHRAVDEICSMLVEAGIDFLRMGSKLSCASQFEPYLISEAMGEKPRLDDMKRRLSRVRVIVSTTSTMLARPFIFSLKHFSLAVVDESSQILEPGIIGLLAGHRQEGDTPGAGTVTNIDKFILIGDYKQLPAVVQQSDSDAAVTDPELRAIGLESCKNSLFERLIRQEQRAGRTRFIGTLNRQGRMHPDIAHFPGDEFYAEEQLQPVPLKHQQEPLPAYLLPSQDALDDMLKAHRLLFIPSKPCRRPDLSDKVNTEEARIVADLLRRICRFYGPHFVPEKTVGIIVPYRNQIAMIRQEIERLGLPHTGGISIDTVERYQGSQRDVIIYSFTVQTRYQLQFLTANTFEENGRLIDRKLNVALTRARRQLILTGHPDTLQASKVFGRLIDFVRREGGYYACNET